MGLWKARAQYLLPRGGLMVDAFSSPMVQRRWWANQSFLMLSMKTFNNKKLILADLQTTELTFEHELDLAANSFLWKNFIIQFKQIEDNDVMRVTKIRRVAFLENDVFKTIGQNNLPFQFDLCGDNIVCWNRFKIVLIDLKNLDDNWGYDVIPSETIETGISQIIPEPTSNNYRTCTVVKAENLQKATLNVKTILYDIFTLRRIETSPGEFSRKRERKLLAFNVDTSSCQPKIAHLSWNGTVAAGTQYVVCNSGNVQQFAFFDSHNNLGIRLEEEELKIYKVDLNNFNVAKSQVHFGNVIIIQDVCPVESFLRKSNILCFNLCGQLVWKLDSGRLGHSRVNLLPTIIIDKRLLLLRGKAKQETVFVKVETGEVASKIPDLQRCIGVVYWLGHRQLNVNESYGPLGHIAEMISFV